MTEKTKKTKVAGERSSPATLAQSGKTALRFQVVIWREGDNMFRDPDVLLSRLMSEKTEYKCYAEHTGEKSQKKHYHCYLRYKTPRKLAQLVSKYGNGVEVMEGDDYANHDYIKNQSPDTFVEIGFKKKKTEKSGYAEFCEEIRNGKSIQQIIMEREELGPIYGRNRHALAIFSEGMARKRCRDDYEGIEELRPWQRHVIDRIEEPVHPRHILWYVDSEGGCGKSTLSRYLLERHNAVIWCPIGKREDVTFQLWKQSNGRPPALIVCELENKKVREISWEALEMAKNGMLSTAKYEGGFYAGQRPHIIIFSNEDPIGNPFTLDRIRVFTIKDGFITSARIE